jgi:metallo-beta-lactamase family protein
MKIKFLGAAGGEVTGSCSLVRAARAEVIVDCGLFQGGRKVEALNRAALAFRRAPDAVLLTHAHLDHVGRLPLLVRSGWHGPVYATPATRAMAELVLRDSARIQQGDAERDNRKRARAGLPPRPPLYTEEQVETVLGWFRPVPYGRPVPVAPGLEAVWSESGHMLGSASIQLLEQVGGRTRRVVFSGDVGPVGAPILRDAEPFRQADAVVLESTYGDRDHRPFRETMAQFIRAVQEAHAQRGRILVPTFAIGRAQLVLTLLAWMFRERRVERFPVYLDSPMAIEATHLYSRHRELYDEEMRRFLRERPIGRDLRSLRLCRTAEESRALNGAEGPCLILAGAGMCNAGRIQHHLRNHLWKPDTHVLITGYQGHGTLGRRLVEREPFVRIHGERVAVRAQVHTLGGLSAHAGRKDLLGWLGASVASRPKVVLTHGEDAARAALADEIRRRHRLEVEVPELGATVEV